MLRIVDWDRNFETYESRKRYKGGMRWVAMPNKMTGSGFRTLTSGPSGMADFGGWCMIVEIASAQAVRGMLPKGSGRNPHDIDGICESLSWITHQEVGAFKPLVHRLLHEIGWLEEVDEHGDPLVTQPPSQQPVTAPLVAAPRPVPVIPTPAASVPRWARDEVFVRFRARYLETGAALIDEDFSEAYEFCWKTLDWEQKAERMKSLETHFEEFRADPRFVPKPVKFIEKEWKRAVKPTSQPKAKAESAVDRLLKEAERVAR